MSGNPRNTYDKSSCVDSKKKIGIKRLRMLKRRKECNTYLTHTSVDITVVRTQ